MYTRTLKGTNPLNTTLVAALLAASGTVQARPQPRRQGSVSPHASKCWPARRSLKRSTSRGASAGVENGWL